MTGYVAFLRAINVAGHARARMDDIKRVFRTAGCAKVRTYIQSGNVLFHAPQADVSRIFGNVRLGLRELLGVEPTVLLRTSAELERLVERNPFKRFDGDIKLYVVFLSAKPARRPRFPFASSKEALEAIGMRRTEVFVVSRRKPNGFYGFPNAFIEQALGVDATSRNWTTVSKIAKLAGGQP